MMSLIPSKLVKAYSIQNKNIILWKNHRVINTK